MILTPYPKYVAGDTFGNILVGWVCSKDWMFIPDPTPRTEPKIDSGDPFDFLLAFSLWETFIRFICWDRSPSIASILSIAAMAAVDLIFKWG